MKNHCWSRRARAIGAVVACTGATIFGSAALVATQTTQAGADPGYTNIATGAPFVGVGSNTIEDLFNAFSGQESSPGVGTPKFYGSSADSFAPNNLPMHDPTTGRRVYSFDAENPYDPTNITTVGCITTTLGGPQFDRPNGSGNGRKALSDAFDPAHTKWWEVGPPNGCVGASPGTTLTGQVDFSRSSSGPSGTLITSPAATCPAATPCITYIPFARDGLTYAYWLGSGVTAAQVDQLSAADLNTIYNVGVAGGATVADVPNVTFFACALQTGSGTWTTFQGDIGNPANAVATGTANNCSALEENSGNDFVAHANGGAVPAANTVWIEPFAASAWIAQANGAAQDRSNAARAEAAPNQVFLGDPDAAAETGGNPNNQPFTGTIPNLVPDPVYNGNSTWGRNIYVIVPWHKIAGAAGQVVPAERAIFGNPFAATPVIGQLCNSAGEAQSILGTFGFTSLSASGQPACDAARPTGDTSNHYAYTEALTTGQG
jgi:hypothetical protein